MKISQKEIFNYFISFKKYFTVTLQNRLTTKTNSFLRYCFSVCSHQLNSYSYCNVTAVRTKRQRKLKFDLWPFQSKTSSYLQVRAGKKMAQILEPASFSEVFFIQEIRQNRNISPQTCGSTEKMGKVHLKVVSFISFDGRAEEC